MSTDKDERLLIRGGLVADGEGSPLIEANVVIAHNKVSDISTEVTRTGEVIDARGLVVAPGFIDTHTHSDGLSFLSSDHDALRLGSVRQGVTTEVAGNCGFSAFPCPRGIEGDRARHHVATLLGSDEATAVDLDAYRAAVDSCSLAANLATLVGHGTVRAAVVGFERRLATEAEIAQMVVLTEQALAAGAAGLSTGLIYSPGSYADLEEIITLARAAERYQRPYVTHIRNEMDGVSEALDEALEIGRRSGASVHISHLKAGGRSNHGLMLELLHRIDQARADGEDVTADIYPYTRGSTMLQVLLPPWVTVGGVKATLDRLKNMVIRDRIRAEIAAPTSDWQNFIAGGSWGDVTVASAPRSPQIEGRSILDIAAGSDPLDVVCDLLIAEEAKVTITVAMAHGADMRRCIAAPMTTVGSDGIPIPGKPHPRWSGSFAKVLGQFVRDEGLLDLPEAIRKMTSLAADRFVLMGRGRLHPGAVADVVVFDPEQVAAHATYAGPLAPPTGVEHVIISGRPIIRCREDTGVRPGVFLRSGHLS